MRVNWTLASIFFVLQLNALSDPSKYIRNKQLVIGSTSKRGFFGCFLSALNNLAWCEQHGITPIVYWDENSCYYDPAGYNNQKKNVWEYYFEPVSSGTFKETDPQYKGFRDLSGNGISLLNGLGVKFNTKEYWFALQDAIKHYIKKYNTREYRLKQNKLIKKYIKIKPQVLEKVDQFYQKHLSGKKTIGIHIRGTDKSTEVNPVRMETFVEAAHELAQRYPDCQFYVATDETAILEEAQKVLKGKVIAYDSYRSSNGKPIHLGASEISKAQLGEEVLIEALLLAKCDGFVHTVTNVSMAVLFFNPDITNILLSNPEK